MIWSPKVAYQTRTNENGIAFFECDEGLLFDGMLPHLQNSVERVLIFMQSIKPPTIKFLFANKIF